MSLARAGRGAQELLLGAMAEIDRGSLVAIGVGKGCGLALAGEQLLERDLATAVEGDGAVLELEQGLGIGDQAGGDRSGLRGPVDGLGRQGPGGEQEARGGENGHAATGKAGAQ